MTMAIKPENRTAIFARHKLCGRPPHRNGAGRRLARYFGLQLRFDCHDNDPIALHQRRRVPRTTFVVDGADRRRRGIRLETNARKSLLAGLLYEGICLTD